MTNIFDDFYPLFEEKTLMPSRHYMACTDVMESLPLEPMSFMPIVLETSHDFPCPDETLMAWPDDTTLSSSVETPVSTPPQLPTTWLYADEELPARIKGEWGSVMEEEEELKPTLLPLIQLPETPLAILFTLSTAAVLKRGVVVTTTGGRVDFTFSDLTECYTFMQSVRCGWERFETDEELLRNLARWIIDIPAPFSRCTPKKPIIVTIKARSHGSSRFAAIRAAVEEVRTFFRQHNLANVTVKR